MIAKNSLVSLCSCFGIFGGLMLPFAPTVSGEEVDWLKSQLSSEEPDEEILHLDIDHDGKVDVIERWWNGRRVRWLDENGDMRADDTRGDQISDVLQIDIDGDGRYDYSQDVNIKWADLDANGIPDLQAVSHNQKLPRERGNFWHRGQWMIFRNYDDRGVLGWMDWSQFDFDCWGHTETCNWLPNYHGDTVFLKIHAPVRALDDLSLNWENPFIFYDFDDDGVCEMTMRWVDDVRFRRGEGRPLDGFINEAFVSFDLDNDSGKGNESDLDFSLRATGRPGLDYREMVNDVSRFVGNPKFDPCFSDNEWRRISELRYISPEDSYEAFFKHDWEDMYLVFDEDDDDHRWERVEMYFPKAERYYGDLDSDIYSLERWEEGVKNPGMSAHPQADSLGDRGEFDQDNSGKGKLYIGVFDRKLHLAGAEWGAWLVDYDGEFHGGRVAPSPQPKATEVREVVKYSDSDGNGFFDTIEYDYDGDRSVDFSVCLLDFSADGEDPIDTVELIDPQELGWEGLHQLFNRMAQQSWVEAQMVYRAAWRKGLTNAELDLLAFASSMAERYHDAYWLKEKLMRHLREYLLELENGAGHEGISGIRDQLIQSFYLGRFEQCVRVIEQIPGK